jgi:hypothetical protein
MLQFQKCHKLWHFSRDAAARLLWVCKVFSSLFIRTLLAQRFQFVPKLADDYLQIFNGGDLFANWLREFPSNAIARYANRLLNAAVTLHLNPGQALLYFQGFSGI